MEELRDLARGIHPPILADRGLGAAVAALAARSPVRVDVSVEGERPSPAVESAAYFVAAEALANAGKHAEADPGRRPHRAQPAASSSRSPTTAAAAPTRRAPACWACGGGSRHWMEHFRS